MRKLALIVILLCAVSASAATTYYVSNSTANGYALGNNANNCTAAATPCLTLAGALAKSPATGDKIILNDGTYAECSGGCIITTGIDIEPQTPLAAVISAGYLSVQVAGGSTLTLGAIVVDGTNTKNYGLRLYDEATKYGLTLNGTKIINQTYYPIDGGAVTKIDVDMEYVTINARIMGDGRPAIGFGLGNLVAGSITINGCDITANFNGATTTGNAIMIQTGAAPNVTLKVTNNVVRYEGASALSSTLTAAIGVAGVPSALISGNQVFVTENSACTGACVGAGIVVRENTAGVGSPNATISNNYIQNDSSLATWGILVGADSSAVTSLSYHKTNHVTVTGNYVVGKAGVSLFHAIELGNQLGGTVSFNVVDNTDIGLLAKGMQGGSYFKNTVYRASAEALYAKASTGTQFAANDLYFVPGQNCTKCEAMFADYDAATSVYTSGVSFTGNNVYMSTPPVDYVAVVGTGSAATFSGNQYFLTTPNLSFYYAGTTYSSYAAWKAAKEPISFLTLGVSTTGSVF